jgi:hypothetical protein
MRSSEMLKLVLIAALLFEAGCEMAPQNKSSTSSNYWEPNRIVRPIPNSALVSEQHDLRGLVCDWMVLRERISRRICTIDRTAFGYPDLSLQVEGKISLRELFKKARLNTEVRDQVRLIQKDSIKQTGLHEKSNDSEFWETVVHPGDIIYVPPRQ